MNPFQSSEYLTSLVILPNPVLTFKRQNPASIENPKHTLQSTLSFIIRNNDMSY